MLNIKENIIPPLNECNSTQKLHYYTVRILRDIAKDKNIVYTSRMKREELIASLTTFYNLPYDEQKEQEDLYRLKFEGYKKTNPYLCQTKEERAIIKLNKQIEKQQIRSMPMLCNLTNQF